MALYRKYRPATFAEVVGQEHVTEPLSAALRSGRINHAYLFSGPRGCGKTSSARILARSLNCVHGPTPEPCGECASCVALAPGGSGNLDVIELDAASHGKVDDTRELREKAFFAPASSRYRVLIIDEAHMVSTAGFNALLKIVEEPPEHLIFIFATTEPEKVLPTIKSRTHHYPFRLLTPTAMRGLVERIATAEGVSVESSVYPLLIRQGGGSPRDTLSVLDQLVAGSGPDGVTYQYAAALLGVTESSLLDGTIEALATRNSAALFHTVDKVIEVGHDPRRFVTDLLQRLRDIIMVKSVPQAIDRGLVDAPGEQAEALQRQAEMLGEATLSRLADEVHAGLDTMRGATAPRLLLEILCARLLLPQADESIAALYQRVEQLERGAPPAAPTAPAASTTPAAPGGSSPSSDTASSHGYVRPSQRRARQPATASPRGESPAQQHGEPARDGAHDGAQVAAAAARASWDAPAGHTSTPSAAVPAEAPADGAGLDVETLRAQWPQVRQAVRERSRTLEVMLADAAVVAVDGDNVLLNHKTAALANRLNEPHHAEVIAAALSSVFGQRQWSTRVDTEATAPRVSHPADRGAPRRAFEQTDQQHQAAPQTPGPPRRDAPPSHTAADYGSKAESAGAEPAEDPEPTDPDPGPQPPEPAEAPDAQLLPEVTEQDMVDEARSGPQNLDHRTPEEIALALLKEHLGAVPLD